VNKPRGIWYTPVTGIWQTVWLEPVPKNWIESLHIVPDIDHGRVTITVNTSATTAGRLVRVAVKSVSNGSQKPAWRVVDTFGRSGQPITIKLPRVYLWSPETPWLYDIQVQRADKAHQNVDEVTSYFGMRKISLARDRDGHLRICLNNNGRCVIDATEAKRPDYVLDQLSSQLERLCQKHDGLPLAVRVEVTELADVLGDLQHNLLYGIPQQTPDNFVHSYPNLRIGGLLETADGTRLEFIRRKGRTKTIREPDDAEIFDESKASSRMRTERSAGGKRRSKN